jgi:signal transduction histidine kinase
MTERDPAPAASPSQDVAEPSHGAPDERAVRETRERQRHERAEIMRSAQVAMERARHIESQLRQLGSAIPTIEEQATRIVTEALRSVGASVAFAARLVGDAQTGQLVLDGAVHLPPEIYAAHELTPIDSELPLAVAARTGQVITCSDEHDITERFPAMSDMLAATGARALCVVPVQQFGELRGAFALLFPERRPFTGPERAQMRALGARYARALHHARLYFSERDARTQAERARLDAERARHDAERAREDAESSRAVLIAMQAELESRIVERTNELAQLNEALTGQILERTRVEDERNVLRRQLISAEEEERRRIARELHDQLGQHLTALALGLDEVAKALPYDAIARRRLAMLQDLTAAMTRDARHLALELRPPELDDVGLASALETYVAQWSQRFGVDADVEVTGLREDALPADAGTTLYRVVQEALTNVAKHARARHASVLVECADREVRLIVEDDGLGFEVEATLRRAASERRLGLAGMRERAELMGGTLAVEASPGSGTALYVRLPLERVARVDADVPVAS